MKLIKITKDHYVVVDDSEIKEGDYIINIQRMHIYPTPVCADDVEYRNRRNDVFKKITHSTQPIECDKMWTPVNGKQWMCNTMLCCGKMLNSKTKPLSLQEVKELIGEVDVEKKAYRFRRNYQDSFEGMNECIMNDAIHRQKGYEAGYNQALEDNKDKKYTEEDMINAFREGTNAGALHERLSNYDNGDYEEAEQYSEQYEESFIQSLQPKTEWEIEEIDGKFKLK